MSLAHPDIIVIGEDYPLPAARSAICKILSLLQIALIVLSILPNFIPSLKALPFYPIIEQNKMIVILFGFFGINMIQGIVGSTGAF